MESPRNNELHDIGDRAMAASRFVGTFVGNSYKEGLRAPLLGDEQACRVRNSAEEMLRDSMSYDMYRSAAGERTTITGLRHTQIELADCIGKGTFSEVYSIKAFHKLQPGLQLNPRKYAVKVLQPKAAGNPQILAKRAADLVKDGLILASLDHPHILKVLGWPPSLLIGLESSGRHDAFFLVLDKLQTTLDKQLDQWKQKSRNLGFAIVQRANKKTSFWMERLEVAVHLADAIMYLHDRRILHRDIKPENVGFDSAGVLKLYDFDVAKIMPELSLVDMEATFRFTQNVGSVRYMSPECGLGYEYNRKSDIYSFSLVLFEILSLEKPFQNIKSYDHEKSVFRVGTRPIVPDNWPDPIRDLLQTGWSPIPTTRPDMYTIYNVLLDQATPPTESEGASPKKMSWGNPFAGKDSSASTPPKARESIALKMGASTPSLVKGKLVVEPNSLSTLDI